MKDKTGRVHHSRNVLFVVIGAFLCSPLYAIDYNVTHLGSLGGKNSLGRAINNLGQVTGSTYVTGGGTHAFLYSGNGPMLDLGTLGGKNSYVYAINESGQVVGSSQGANGTHAYLYSNGQMLDLGTFGGPDSLAWNINNAGQVVGSADLPNGLRHAFLYNNGQVQNLGVLPGGYSSYATAINSSGYVLGVSDSSTGTRAFLYTGNGPLQDLGALDGNRSQAFHINDAGSVTGNARKASGQWRAFIYKGNGPMQDLGTFGGTRSYANAINASDQVVGYAYTAGDAEAHAFLYSGSGPLQDLGTLGGVYSVAYDINASGQIVGTSLPMGGSHSSHKRAFLYSDGQMINLNIYVPPNTDWVLTEAKYINDSGYILAQGRAEGWSRAFLLTPIPETITVQLDIKPDDYPNPLNINTKGNGRLPMAIFGTEEVPAEDIVPVSIMIAGIVSPLKISTDKDVNGDGLIDLMMHFSRRGLIDALSLDTYAVGDTVDITVKATRAGDGCPIEATDSILIVGHKD